EDRRAAPRDAAAAVGEPAIPGGPAAGAAPSADGTATGRAAGQPAPAVDNGTASDFARDPVAGRGTGRGRVPRTVRGSGARPAQDADQVTIPSRARLRGAEARDAARLADAAAAADGVGPLSEQVRLHLEYGGDGPARDLLLRRGPALAGYSHLAGPDPEGHRSGELVIHPAHRRRGLGLALARAAVAEASPLPVRIWAH